MVGGGIGVMSLVALVGQLTWASRAKTRRDVTVRSLLVLGLPTVLAMLALVGQAT